MASRRGTACCAGLRRATIRAFPQSDSSPVDFQTLKAFAAENPLPVLIFAGVTAALIFNEISGLFRGYTALVPAQLTHLINREDALVIDLSASADFEKGHIAGSRNVQASAFGPDNKPLAGADKARPVVLTCRNGNASADAAKKLHKAGFGHVYWLDGGVAAWQQADLPLVKGR